MLRSLDSIVLSSCLHPSLCLQLLQLPSAYISLSWPLGLSFHLEAWGGFNAVRRLHALLSPLGSGQRLLLPSWVDWCCCWRVVFDWIPSSPCVFRSYFSQSVLRIRFFQRAHVHLRVHLLRTSCCSSRGRLSCPCFLLEVLYYSTLVLSRSV